MRGNKRGARIKTSPFLLLKTGVELGCVKDLGGKAEDREKAQDLRAACRGNARLIPTFRPLQRIGSVLMTREDWRENKDVIRKEKKSWRKKQGERSPPTERTSSKGSAKTTKREMRVRLGFAAREDADGPVPKGKGEE